MDIKEFKEKFCKYCRCECQKGLVETHEFIRCVDKMITVNKDSKGVSEE